MKRAFLVFLFFGVVLNAQSLSWEEKTFLTMENQANNGLERSVQPSAIQYIEIPMKYLDFSTHQVEAKALAPDLFRKSFFLWPISPTDKEYYHEIIRFLSSTYQFTPRIVSGPSMYETASRSLLIPSQVEQALLTVKASTSDAHGPYKDKPVKASAAEAAISMTRYFSQVPNSDLQVFQSVLEPLVVKLLNPKQSRLGDHSLIFRLYPKTKGRTVPISLFAFLHQVWGVKLAKANGYSDPVVFIQKVILPMLAKAAAEQFFVFGVTSNSGHSQNWTLRINQKLKLTGTAELRDFADAHLSKALLSAHDGTSLLEQFKNSANNHLYELDGVWLQLAPFQTNKLPTWLSSAEADRLNWETYELFAAEVNRLAGTKSFRLTWQRGGSVSPDSVQTRGVFTINPEEQTQLVEASKKFRSRPKSCAKRVRK